MAKLSDRSQISCCHIGTHTLRGDKNIPYEAEIFYLKQFCCEIKRLVLGKIAVRTRSLLNLLLYKLYLYLHLV